MAGSAFGSSALPNKDEEIALLFGLLYLLEDVGYMARPAFVVDRLMGRVGLEGRAFVALLSSYACAVPGIMATRTIPSPRDRLSRSWSHR